MARAFRILLWAVVLLAPGGILLAPFLAAHELRLRRAAASEAARPSTMPEGAPAAIAAEEPRSAAVVASPSGQLAA